MMIKMEKLVSIIIPVYNSAAFLERTLTSVLGQTYKNIEVLLIDDGSTDNSGEICDKFRETDSRVRVFREENSGVSAARNLGLCHMRGELCQFVDGDDVVPENYTETMAKKLEESGCDVVFCGVAKILQGVRYSFELKDEVLSVDEYLYELYRGDRFVTKSACIGLYRADVIRREKIRFPENICCGEDSIFVMRYMKHCKSVGAVPDTIYHYMCDNGDSATSAVYYDHFLVEMERYELASQMIGKDERKKAVAQFYMNQEIRELVQYVSFSGEPYGAKVRALRKFVKNERTGYAIRFYKRDDKRKSRMIPVMIRLRTALGLYLALKHRRIVVDNGRFQREKVRSAYR